MATLNDNLGGVEQKTEKKKHNCPKCEVGLTQRIHRGALIKALFPNTIKRYFCTRCLHKYYVVC